MSDFTEFDINWKEHTMSSWLKPPKLIYLIVGLPLAAAALGLIGQAIGLWTFQY